MLLVYVIFLDRMHNMPRIHVYFFTLWHSRASFYLLFCVDFFVCGGVQSLMLCPQMYILYVCVGSTFMPFALDVS
jgi:hypothetical protein